MKIRAISVVAAIIAAAFSIGAAVSTETKPLEAGSKAPDFKLKDQNGNERSLGANAGKWVVIAFYPKDNSPGCSLEARSIQAGYAEFEKRNAVVWGISTQDIDSKKEFCEAEELTFPLLSDTTQSVSRLYGVLQDNGMAKRVTYIIDPAGVIVKRIDTVDYQRHGQDLLHLLDTLIEERPASYKPRTEGLKAIAPGDKAPSFQLPGGGKTHTLASLSGKKFTVIVWVSAQCPVSKAYESRMKALAAKYKPMGVNFIGINSNHTESDEFSQEHFNKSDLGFPILRDPDNKTADTYGALVTPDVFVIDAKGVVKYQGAIDDEQDEQKVKEHYLDNALAALVKGESPKISQTKSFGCSIKRVRK